MYTASDAVLGQQGGMNMKQEVKKAIAELLKAGLMRATGELRRNRKGELEPVYCLTDAGKQHSIERHVYLLSKKDDTGGLAVTSRSYFFDDEAGGCWVNERSATRYATREEAETVINRRRWALSHPDDVSVVERNN